MRPPCQEEDTLPRLARRPLPVGMRRGVDCNRTLKLLPWCEQPGWLSSCLKHISFTWRSCGGMPRGALSHRGIRLLHIEERARQRKSGASCRTSRTRSPRDRASEYAVDLGCHDEV